MWAPSLYRNTHIYIYVVNRLNPWLDNIKSQAFYSFPYCINHNFSSQFFQNHVKQNLVPPYLFSSEWKHCQEGPVTAIFTYVCYYEKREWLQHFTCFLDYSLYWIKCIIVLKPFLGSKNYKWWQYFSLKEIAWYKWADRKNRKSGGALIKEGRRR